MPGKKKKYNARFPPARIKKIMQSDEEVGKVAAPVPVIISRALELFVHSLLTRAGEITASRHARTLTPSHLKQCIMTEQRFDFLQDLFSSVPDIGTEPDSENEPITPITPGTPGTPVFPTSFYPFSENQNVETSTRGRGRGRGRGRARGHGRSDTDSTPHFNKVQPTGRPRGRPRKVVAIPPSVAVEDSDDESDDALELDLDGTESDTSEDDSKSGNVSLENNRKRSEDVVAGPSLKADLFSATNSHLKPSGPSETPGTLPSYTLPKGIQITIPGMQAISSINSPISPTFSNSPQLVSTNGNVKHGGVPVSVITSTQTLYKVDNALSAANKKSQSLFPSTHDVDEDYDA